MTPEQLKNVAEGFNQRARQATANGEREAANVYAECASILGRYARSVKAPEPPSAPVGALTPAPEPEKDAPAPKRRQRKPKAG